jgi:hypothetical protein
MVVELVHTNFTDGELENNLYNSFQVTVPEDLNSGHPFLHQLTHLVQHEGGQSKPYHYVLFLIGQYLSDTGCTGVAEPTSESSPTD